MTDNVVDMFTHKVEEKAYDPVAEFIHSLLEWAEDQGIDTDSADFRYDGAAIMTILQGMVQRA